MAKEIQLTKGLVTIVDDYWYDYLNEFNWMAHKCSGIFYAERRNGGEFLKMHRVILGLTDRNIKVDHIDRDSLNNREYNLRICTQQENTFNRPIQSNSSNEFKGVTFDNRRNKWLVRITYSNKRYHLGYFNTEKEAALEYNEAAKYFFGEFAYLNDVK